MPGEESIRFSAERGLKVDLGAIRDFGRLVDSVKPDLVHVGGTHSVANHVMVALWQRPRTAAILDRGAIGGINLLNPADWFTFFTRPNQSIRCVSEAVAAHLARGLVIRLGNIAGRLEILPLPIPELPANRLCAKEAREELGLDPRSFIVGTICRVRPIKNLGPVAEAVCSLRDFDPRVQMAVIGSAGHQPEMRSILSRSAAHPPVFLGVHPAAGRLLSAFDVFVSPTRFPGEGFGNRGQRAYSFISSKNSIFRLHFSTAT
jgi:glycosyltransferase involved in cell wall biosynthesis